MLTLLNGGKWHDGIDDLVDTRIWNRKVNKCIKAMSALEKSKTQMPHHTLAVNDLVSFIREKVTEDMRSNSSSMSNISSE